MPAEAKADQHAAGFAVRSRLLDPPSAAASDADERSMPTARPPRAQPQPIAMRGLAADTRDPFPVRFVWLLIALAAIGYVGWSWARPRGAAEVELTEAKEAEATAQANEAEAKVAKPDAPKPDAPKPDAPKPAPSDGKAAPAPSPAPPSPPTVGVPSSRTPLPSAAATMDETVEFGRVLPFIDTSRGVAVAPDQGLLVVETDRPSEPTRVKIAGKDRGAAPLSIALQPGRHELTLSRKSGTSFRYLVIRAGETRVVSIHPGAP
jgi:hypothetical protein